MPQPKSHVRLVGTSRYRNNVDSGAVGRERPKGADLVDPADAAYRHIIDAALKLMEFGFHPQDPDIAGRAIRVGRSNYLKDQAAREKADLQEEDRARRAVLAAEAGEVVYYMRIGNRIKIGWSTNLTQRLATINPEELLAVEPGGRDAERIRHVQFAGLRVFGEWFRAEEPLLGHIANLKDTPAEAAS